MPISSSAATLEKKKAFQTRNKLTNASTENAKNGDKDFLTIGPALPKKEVIKLFKRSHSTLGETVNARECAIANNKTFEQVTVFTSHDGMLHVARTQQEKEKNPDRISLDRRGLSTLPKINDENRLRLLSLQHNLINNLDGFKSQRFPFLVFLDVYDNQIEKINCLDNLENLRVLLMGKNRIKRIEGLSALKKIEVLDLHGNQILHVGGLSTLADLKVLNLAGNQIRSIGISDFHGLLALQELNLRRNKLKKLLCFGETPNLLKLFLSNNEINVIEDMCSIAKAGYIKELTIDNNPVSMAGDSASFVVSYLPHLTHLSGATVTDQMRKSAMAWRRNKEATNPAFMDLTTDVCANVRREDVISNARTNWELLRSQTTKCCLATKTASTSYLGTAGKDVRPENDFILTSLSSKAELKPNPNNYAANKTVAVRKAAATASSAAGRLVKMNLGRTSSQDTENSQNTSSSNASANEVFKLPPILVPLINKQQEQQQKQREASSAHKYSNSISSVGPNVDSSVSSLPSTSRSSASTCSATSSSSRTTSPSTATRTDEEAATKQQNAPSAERPAPPPAKIAAASVCVPNLQIENGNSSNNNNNGRCSVTNRAAAGGNPETSSNLSSNSNGTTSSSGNATTTASDKSLPRSVQPASKCRNVKSAVVNQRSAVGLHSRAATAKATKIVKTASPEESFINKDREQGGDYLIEICGRHLNIYGQGALRFIDKSWNATKSQDVNTINFNYVNFNGIVMILSKLKNRFPNAEHFNFKETNIQYLSQLNALADIQGMSSLHIDTEGNPITQKVWKNYAIYRLSHWGLKSINGNDISEDEIERANNEYQSLSDLVLWSLPEIVLQPLLVKLRIDANQSNGEQNAKKWLNNADSALRSVVCKEALQWRKGSICQEDQQLRQKAKIYMGTLVEDTCNIVEKLRTLDQEWPGVLQEIVQNILLDYSHLDTYMKRNIQELK